MAFTTEQVEKILGRIIHPSTEKDIVSMGLVKDVTINDNNISFNLSFQAFNDPLKSSLKKACEQMLVDELGHGVNIDVKVVTPVRPAAAKPEALLSKVKNIIAVSSGKGGVGKSTVAVNLASAFASAGSKVGIIDADIFGPSIPKMLGIEDAKPSLTQKDGKDKIIPIEKYGMKILSIGFFVDKNDATIWRGPMASNALKQLLTDGDWDGLDYLFIDLPPGTSDIHITISQDVKLTGAIIVSTPQEVAIADVVKGISMFRNKGIEVPILGLVENMAWFTPAELPKNKYYIFGKGGCQRIASEMKVPFLGSIPIIQSISQDGDNGTPSVLNKNHTAEYFKNIAQAIHVEILKAKTLVN